MLYGDRLFNALERVDPEPGMLLVSAPGMLSTEFARSVILIIEDTPSHSLGVRLTTRSELPVALALPQWLPAVAQPQAMYIGGPLNHKSAIGLAVTKSGVDIDASPYLQRLAPRLAHVDLRAEPEEVFDLVESVRLFAGYVEWAPRQLQEEIEHGDWFVSPALPGDVVAPARQDLWSDVLRRQPMPLPLFSTFPGDIDDN